MNIILWVVIYPIVISLLLWFVNRPIFGSNMISNPFDVIVKPGEQGDLVFKAIFVRWNCGDADEHWQAGVVVKDDVRGARVTLQRCKK